MKYKDQSPELKEALAYLMNVEATNRPDEAFHHGEMAKAYALVSIAQSLEKLAGCVAEDADPKSPDVLMTGRANGP